MTPADQPASPQLRPQRIGLCGFYDRAVRYPALATIRGSHENAGKFQIRFQFDFFDDLLFRIGIDASGCALWLFSRTIGFGFRRSMGLGRGLGVYFGHWFSFKWPRVVYPDPLWLSIRRLYIDP